MRGKRNPLDIALSERWFLGGMTGSGKTTFAKQLLMEMRKLWPNPPLYVLDSTNKGDFDNWPGIVEQDKPPAPLRRPGDVQIWQPRGNDLGAYDAWFTSIVDVRKPAIVLVDELASISNRSGDAVQGYQLLQKQGRGHNICVISLSQEMAYIARQATNQASHFVRFGFQAGEYDAKKANRMVGRPPVAEEPPHEHGFWYARVNKRPVTPVYFDSFKTFF